MQLGPRFTLYVRDTAVITGLCFCLLDAPNFLTPRSLSTHARTNSIHLLLECLILQLITALLHAPAYLAVFIALESQSSPAYSPSPEVVAVGFLSSDIFQRRSGSEFAHSRDLRLLRSFSAAARSSAS